MNFETWKRRVRTIIFRTVGFDPDDLTDFPYWEAWQSGRKPVAVAHDVLVANGYYAA